MSNQSVGTPRFYVDIIQFAGKTKPQFFINRPGQHQGQLINQWYNSDEFDTYLGTNPSTGKIKDGKIMALGLDVQTNLDIEKPPYNSDYYSYVFSMPFDTRLFMKKQIYFAALGHNFKTTGIKNLKYGFGNLMVSQGSAPDLYDLEEHSLLNICNGGTVIDFDGFSIGYNEDGISEEDKTHLGLFFEYDSSWALDWDDLYIHKLSIGNFYDMPKSPNLSLTVENISDDKSSVNTISGNTITNSMGRIKQWGDLPQWTLRDPYTGTTAFPSPRAGYGKETGEYKRRGWNLSWSYMSDNSLMGANQLLSNVAYTTTGYNSEDLHTNESGQLLAFDYDLMTHDNFFSQVWHKSLGGTLPFIFQPDNTNNSPDAFAICKIVENSLKITQSAYNVYDISLKIEEVW